MHQKGSLREVIHISWPIAMAMLSFSVMDLTDTIMVGQLGIDELAAVGMSTAVMFSINAFFIGFFESVKILVAQAVGADQYKLARQAGWHGLYLAIPLGFLVVCLAFSSTHIFDLFGGPENIQTLSSDYFVLRLWASPPWFITLVLASYYQGTGNTRLPMMVNIFMCVINIVVSQALIFGFGPIPAYGLAGSAYGTVISDFLGMLIILGYFIRDVGFEWRIKANLMGKLFLLGVPVGIRWLLDTGGWTFAMILIAREGTMALAANQIATKIMSLSLLPVYGISEAVCILAGQSTGAQDFPAVRRSYWSAIQISVTLMIITGLAFLLVPMPLVSLFQKNTEVLIIASEILMMVGAYQILAAFSLVTAGTLNGTGDTRFTMVLIILSTCFVMVPTAYLFGVIFKMGVYGMWLSLIAHETVLVLGTQWRFRSSGWRHHEAVALKAHAH
ncbi:MAG: MATE family efflux transporter [Deltaproteobacteria bacterium]|nr:MATE family efflux transporter [Deltaproteobacteria bacterium]